MAAALALPAQAQVPRRDLVVTAVTDPPAVAAPGSSFGVTDTVQNLGSVAAGASTTRYYLSIDTVFSGSDAVLTGSRTVRGLPSGESSTGTVTVTIPADMASGSYYLLACADADGVVAEDDETNNCRGSSTQTVVARPDLVVTAVTNPPAVAAPGSSFEVTDTVQNSGSVAAGASTTRYYLSIDTVFSGSDAVLTGNRAVASVPAGASSTGTVTVTIPADVASGSYYLLACADADGAVAEDDETNNCRASLALGEVQVQVLARYFAEGSANDFFDCYFALANPSSTAANVVLRFLRDDAVTITQAVQVPAWARRTVNAKDVPGLAPVGGFSTVVESDVEIAADRTMMWDSTGYGSHAETAVMAPATTWYLAEGATHSGFDLYYLIQNPNDFPVDVQISYLRPAPLAPIVLSYPGIAPHSRKTIYVNGENPGLAAVDISGIVTSLTPGGPIIVERAMYLNSRGLFFRAGHDSAGVTAPATDWFLAEGATGFFDLFVLVANPNTAEAHLTVTYLLPGGATVSSPLTVAPNSRWTVYVNGQAPDGVSLANTAVSTKVHSDLPVLVERAMWWPSGGPSVWEEAHNSPGVTSAATRWALADGEQGGARNTDTYVLIANTSAFAGTVRVTALLEDGTTLARDVAVPGNSRTTIFTGDFPDPLVSPFGNLLANKRFGTLIESLSGPSGTAEIVVERAMYSDANGVHWAAGTDVVATRLVGSPR